MRPIESAAVVLAWHNRGVPLPPGLRVGTYRPAEGVVRHHLVSRSRGSGCEWREGGARGARPHRTRRRIIVVVGLPSPWASTMPGIQGSAATAGVWEAWPALSVVLGWTSHLVEGLQCLEDLSHMDHRAAVQHPQGRGVVRGAAVGGPGRKDFALFGDGEERILHHLPWVCVDGSSFAARRWLPGERAAAGQKGSISSSVISGFHTFAHRQFPTELPVGRRLRHPPRYFGRRGVQGAASCWIQRASAPNGAHL